MKRMLLLLLITSLAVMGCATAGPNTTNGAVLGTVLGGATGALVGSGLGNPWAGAAIGAGVGGLTGGAIGNAQDTAEYAAGRYQSRTVYVAPPPAVAQAPAPPPGRWVTVPGQWVGGRWVPAHKAWIPMNP
jgi:hypothetical protein